MRLSIEHKKIIEEMESCGCVWLSHLPPATVMRFRYRVKKGFKSYMKVGLLTFIPKRTAETLLAAGRPENGGKKLTAKQQRDLLEAKLFDAEKELFSYQKVAQQRQNKEK